MPVNNPQQSIGIFGGTFDPPHFGHLQIAKAVTEKLSLDAMYFVPANKTVHREQPLADATHRLAMVNYLINNESKLYVSDCEINRGGDSFMVDTLQEFHNQYSSSSLFLLLGQDAFNSIETWHQPETIIQLANLVVVSRPNYTLHAPAIYKNINYQVITQKMTGKLPMSGDIFMINHMALNAASTKIRQLIKNNYATTDYLPNKVRHYIDEHELYS